MDTYFCNYRAILRTVIHQPRCPQKSLINHILIYTLYLCIKVYRKNPFVRNFQRVRSGTRLKFTRLIRLPNFSRASVHRVKLDFKLLSVIQHSKRSYNHHQVIPLLLNVNWESNKTYYSDISPCFKTQTPRSVIYVYI